MKSERESISEQLSVNGEQSIVWKDAGYSILDTWEKQSTETSVQ